MLRSRFAPTFKTLLSPIAACSILALGAVPNVVAQKSKPVPAITIDSSVTIVESAQETGPVKRATQDLLGDFTKVFGQAPKLVSTLEEAGPVAILIADRTRMPAGLQCATATDTEAFAFSTATVPGNAKPKRVAVCLTGADMRGTIFAIYQ